MTKIIKILLLLLAAVLLLTACKKEQPADEEDPALPPFWDEAPADLETFTFTRDDFPRMDGSPGTVPLAQALAAVMLGESRESVENLAVFTRTTQAFRNLASGLCDILITGEPSPSVMDEIARRDFRYDMAPIAKDALVFIVSASNPVDNLTSAQVKAIYSGELTGWQQAGGRDLDIAAFQRNEEATSQVLMNMLVMDWDKMADAPMQTILPGYYMYGDDQATSAIKGFDGSDNAISYTMYYYAVNMGMADGYKILSIDGVMPTPDTIASGAYPFINPCYAVVSRDLPEDDGARILYNWLLSGAGQDFITSQGYVSMKDSAAQSGAEFEPLQMRWNVVTDDSKLTPYNPLISVRLFNTALPALEPYNGYGSLLPYSVAVTMNDGSIHAVKYGFVTEQNGTIVTDPVYDNVYRASYSAQTMSVTLPVYHLHKDLPEGDPEFGYRTIQAACAADGSWITPFSYTGIVFRGSIMFLMYSDDTFDIDVFDYNGNFLYNILDLEWADRISENEWPWYLMYSENDGYGFLQLDDGTYVMMDMLTGSIRETDFINVYMFSDGLACVMPQGSNGLWGFVDKDLEFIIPPGYVREAEFVNGRAIVETPDGMQHVINKQGEVLYSVEGAYFISSLPDGYGYALYSPASSQLIFPKFLTYDFNEIEYPADALPLGPESGVRYLYNGWFSCMTEDGIWLFSSTETHMLPASVQDVEGLTHGFIKFIEYDPDFGSPRYGVMALDGTVIVPLLDGQTITAVVEGNAVRWFAVNMNITGNTVYNYLIGESYMRVTYMLVDTSGQAVKSDPGILMYDEASGYLCVQGTDRFTWMSIDGDVFISIPSMAYTFD